jgi:sialate O-acetylesterase
MEVGVWLGMQAETVLAPQRNPGSLYRGLLVPLAPYRIAGVIWHQGESNVVPRKVDVYLTLMKSLIRDWRRAFGRRELPFLFVQLASFGLRVDDPGAPSPWSLIREAQLRTLAVPNTGMAVAIDIGDSTSLHPTNKRDVGRRLALQALSKVYGRDVVASGPLPRKWEFGAGGATIDFDHAEDGLMTSEGSQVQGFVMAGADRKWHWAIAKIDGARITVRSDRVPEPVAVRYGWANNPRVNLQNTSGLPASPFRTDTW